MSDRSKALWFAVISFVVASVVLFGTPMKPFQSLMLFADRIPNYVTPGLSVGVISALIVGRSLHNRPTLRAGAAIVALMFGVFITTWMLTANARLTIQAEFEPDAYYNKTFWTSVRNAPADFQLFLHGAALKDCKPYGWSYREMAYYPLAPNIAVNVLPQDWLEACNITRETR